MGRVSGTAVLCSSAGYTRTRSFCPAKSGICAVISAQVPSSSSSGVVIIYLLPVLYHSRTHWFSSAGVASLEGDSSRTLRFRRGEQPQRRRSVGCPPSLASAAFGWECPVGCGGGSQRLQHLSCSP